jgi:hypothetical protein
MRWPFRLFIAHPGIRDEPSHAKNPSRMTVHDRLLAAGASPEEACEAAIFLARYVPVEQSVILTDEILAAARAEDGAMVMALLAPEVEPDDFELEAIRELEEGRPEDREFVPFAYR